MQAEESDRVDGDAGMLVDGGDASAVLPEGVGGSEDVDGDVIMAPAETGDKEAVDGGASRGVHNDHHYLMHSGQHGGRNLSLESRDDSHSGPPSSEQGQLPSAYTQGGFLKSQQ